MTSLAFIRLCLALPIALAIALAVLNPQARGGFVWQLLLLASAPYVPVALYASWRLGRVPTEAGRVKLLAQALVALLLLVCVDLFIEQSFSGSASLQTSLLVVAITAVISCVYTCIAVLLYLWLRAVGVFNRAAGGRGFGPRDA